MPEAVGSHLPASETSTPQSLCLFLPHDLTVPLSLTPSSQHLLTVKAQLQHAQVSNALSELHQSLAVYSHLRMSKIQEATGQRALTQANNLLQKSKAHTDAIAEKYRVARAALMKLKGHGEWELCLQDLKNDDMRAMTEPGEHANSTKWRTTDPTSFGH
ncbi:hypothetical protein BS47DRAFT_1392825 [Hydnum rufescens UP504]|uniref:Uncharacterized protein n=1 Tax=Hydnum rufescens UP504 TaxID=1448309 RepID=A0A9P6AYJ3_9AGAM|nr:hypothetical protein BS47DRAFT_1392825 [Hydnum rufescens UP504]